MAFTDSIRRLFPAAVERNVIILNLKFNFILQYFIEITNYVICITATKKRNNYHSNSIRLCSS